MVDDGCCISCDSDRVRLLNRPRKLNAARYQRKGLPSGNDG
jgi:hypothetical protein